MFNSIYTYIFLDIVFIGGGEQGTQQYLDEATCFLGHIQEYHKHHDDSAALGVCRRGEGRCSFHCPFSCNLDLTVTVYACIINLENSIKKFLKPICQK